MCLQVGSQFFCEELVLNIEAIWELLCLLKQAIEQNLEVGWADIVGKIELGPCTAALQAQHSHKHAYSESPVNCERN